MIHACKNCCEVFSSDPFNVEVVGAFKFCSEYCFYEFYSPEEWKDKE